jgi:hypothetical protein
LLYLNRKFFTSIAIAALVGAAGCSGHAGNTLPNMPSSHTGDVTHATQTVAVASLFHKNSEKYSDTGSHPVTGRSGSAVVQSRALLAKDGTTLVEATTGTLDAQPGSGNIRHVTVTPTLANGTEDETQAYNNLKAGGYWSHTYTGLAHNQAVRVDTNITNLDPRTDVVTTNDTVKKRPDLSALRLDGPQKAYPNQQVTFTATVGELNGDVGANADCVLSADGHQVDQSQGIWVDAAGTVSCTFQTSFSTTGTKHLSVSVASVVPGDWDTSNNAAQTTIDIVDPTVKLHVYFNAYSNHSTHIGTETYTDPASSSSTAYSNAYTYSGMYMDAYTYDHQFAFPAQQVSLNLTADGNDAYTNDFASVMGSAQTYYDETCQYGFQNDGYVNLCSGPSWTSIWGEIYGNAATYYSNSITTSCSSAGCTTNSWISNSAYLEGNPFVLGHSNVLTVKLADSAGTQFSGSTDPAIGNTSTWSNPYSNCWGYGWYYGGTSCDNGTDTETYTYANGWSSNW